MRMLFEHRSEHESQWATICSVAAKPGCDSETLRRWVRQHEHDGDLRDGAAAAERERIKTLEREVRELRQANEILRKSSA